MNIDISNAHCGPRISFPDHAWLRVVYKNEPDCSLARESVDLGARLYLLRALFRECRRQCDTSPQTKRKKIDEFVRLAGARAYRLESTRVLPIVLRRVPELSRTRLLVASSTADRRLAHDQARPCIGH